MERLPHFERPTVQDAVLDRSYQPDDAVARVQRKIFVHLYGEQAWTDSTFQGERDDCLRLAAQFQEIFREKWTLFNAAERLTVHSSELVFGTSTPTEEARQAIQDYAESYLEDLAKVFMGDGRMRPEFRTKGSVS